MLDGLKGPGGIFFATLFGNRDGVFLYIRGLISRMVEKFGSALWSWLQILEMRFDFNFPCVSKQASFCDREDVATCGPF